jgi:hypothetical protein
MASGRQCDHDLLNAFVSRHKPINGPNGLMPRTDAKD